VKKLNIDLVKNVNYQQREVYRTLRTNIEFTGIENQIIAITSCIANEGKSTVAYNLASMLAETGKKTLYIDADLRKSVLLKKLGVKGSLPGLTHFLSGQKTINEVTYATQNEHFFILPTGPFPTNPTELLGNERFGELMQLVRTPFEYVIIDCPPLGAVIDAAVVAKKVDGSIMVIEANQVSRWEAQNTVKQLKLANPNILGVVLNKLDYKVNSYYSGKYGYYNHYENYENYENDQDSQDKGEA